MHVHQFVKQISYTLYSRLKLSSITLNDYRSKCLAKREK